MDFKAAFLANHSPREDNLTECHKEIGRRWQAGAPSKRRNLQGESMSL